MIRIATPTDFDFIYELYMHPQVNPYLLYEQMDRDSFRLIFNELLSKGIKYVFKENDTAIGMCKLVPYTYRSSHIVYLGGLAIHPSYAGIGYGHSIIKEIINYTKDRGFSRIELSVATGNSRAIALYEKEGFQKEGLLKKYTFLSSENKYLDEILMAFIS